MQTPYEILDITTDASDDEIKQAYLQQVKMNPPDRNQQAFSRIHDAYTQIKDHHSRVSHELFTLPSADFDQLIDQALPAGQTITLDSDSFKKILNSSLDETSLLNALSSTEK